MRIPRGLIRAYNGFTVQPGEAMTVKEMGAGGRKLTGSFS